MGWVAEADGGSRGNPGPAAYGSALLRDGVLVADRGETIGIATNNVAEYRGLIAALELYHEHAEGAVLEVRMDSKLVVEQMSGNWQIKDAALKKYLKEEILAAYLRDNTNASVLNADGSYRVTRYETAEDLVEAAPKPVKEGVTKEEAALLNIQKGDLQLCVKSTAFDANEQVLYARMVDVEETTLIT